MDNNSDLPAFLIGDAGRLLFPVQDWRQCLADALGVNLRTVQRWCSGSVEPAPGVWRDLSELIRTSKTQRHHSEINLLGRLHRASGAVIQH
jgi:hypothetical protein